MIYGLEDAWFLTRFQLGSSKQPTQVQTSPEGNPAERDNFAGVSQRFGPGESHWVKRLDAVTRNTSYPLVI